MKPEGVRPLALVPVTRDVARRFVGEHHRHNLPPLQVVVCVGVASEGELVGVAIGARPVARMLDDGLSLEIVRACTLGTPNANSMLYGAMCRAAAAMGYHRVYTYTLKEESGSSLRGSGFVCDKEVPAEASWARPSRPRYQTDLFGNDRRPAGPKLRWRRDLVLGVREVE